LTFPCGLAFFPSSQILRCRIIQISNRSDMGNWGFVSLLSEYSISFNFVIFHSHCFRKIPRYNYIYFPIFPLLLSSLLMISMGSYNICHLYQIFIRSFFARKLLALPISLCMGSRFFPCRQEENDKIFTYTLILCTQIEPLYSGALFKSVTTNRI